jgi:serine/threonine-protein kinase
MTTENYIDNFSELVLDERYAIQGLLDKGGDGFVCLAKDLKEPSKKYAVKILNPERALSEETLTRFKREFEILKSLRHPNIVEVYDFNRSSEGFWYMVMEYVSGGSLYKKLFSIPDRQMPFFEAMKTLLEISKAVAFLHGKGLIHRDLKPGNILLTPSGTVKLTDFGIARKTKEDLRLTETGQIIGSPYYMAPEQGLGRKVTFATDVYALGIIAFEMVIGRVPFEGESLFEVVRNHCSEPMPTLCVKDAGVPCWFENFVRRATMKSAGTRIKNAMEFYKELETTIDRFTREKTKLEELVDFLKPYGTMCTFLRNKGIPSSASRIATAVFFLALAYLVLD